MELTLSRESTLELPPGIVPVSMLVRQDKLTKKSWKEMGRVKYTTEQIIVKLREIEVLCGQGKTIAEASRQASITEQTYYRWRKEYGGMNVSDARRLKELEKENSRLKKLVAGLSLDNAILKDVNSKTSEPDQAEDGR
jgi:putative transposase